MKTESAFPNLIHILLAAVLGFGLGYIQWNIPSLEFIDTPDIWPSISVLLPAFTAGWCVSVVAFGILITKSSHRQLGARAITIVLVLWLCTILGGMGFFFFEGMDYMTWKDIISWSAYFAAAYNFGLILLPVLMIYGLSRYWRLSRR